MKCGWFETQAVPLMKDGNIEEVMDPRLLDGNSDKKMIQCMARAALLCLNSPHPRPSISKVTFHQSSTFINEFFKMLSIYVDFFIFLLQ